MKRVIVLTIFFVFLFVIGYAQNAPDSLDVAGTDTIVVREYGKNGKLSQTTTWIGSDFRFQQQYWGGTPPDQFDTLEAIADDTVYVTRYDANGRPKWESVEVNGDYLHYRSYYYDDTIWGYTEMDPRIKNSPYEVREFYLDSTPRIIGTMYRNKKEGSYKTYYKNGNPQCDCYFKHDVRDSTQHQYYENGNTYYTGYYVNGREHGVITKYYDNGNKEWVYRKVNGAVEDTTYDYHENGQLWTTMVYRDGKPWEVISEFDEKGNPRPLGTLKNGNGTVLTYHDDNTLAYTEYYKNGRKVKKKYAK